MHDRATRGETLSPEERAQLEEWYAAQDRAEADDLSLTEPAETIAALQAQIALALERLVTVARQIQKTDEENQALRRENAALCRQLRKSCHNCDKGGRSAATVA